MQKEQEADRFLTAAALYFKLGDKENARLYATQAIDKAENSGAFAEETKALLEKINQM